MTARTDTRTPGGGGGTGDFFPTVKAEEYEFHPVSNIFPMMTEEERLELTQDIRENGLREPIWIHEGRIIDGRNRYLACREAEVKPSVRYWDGEGSLVSFVISLNLRRRHLDKSQRGAIAAEALPLFEAEARERQLSSLRKGEELPVPANLREREKGESSEKAGEAFGVGARYVQEAKAVKEAAPELFEQVKDGLTNLHDAYRQVRKEAQREERKATVHQAILPATGEVERAASIAHVATGSIDLTFTDPPYNISHSSRLTKVGVNVIEADFDGPDAWDTDTRDSYLARLDGWVSEWARVTRPGGAVVSFIDRRLMSHLWDLMEAHGLSVKSHVSWIKRNAAPNGALRRNLHSSTEMILWAVKPGSPYTFNEVDGWDRRNYIETNIITASEKVDHPNQKPLCVLSPLIELTTNPGDLVLDPFAGSGSTGVACHRLNRRYHLVEQDEDYFILARHRIAQECAA